MKSARQRQPGFRERICGGAKSRLLSVVNRALGRFDWQLNWKGKCDLLESVLVGAYHPGFFFIQIGANDGVSFDPIHSFVTSRRCSGLVVEPIQDYSEELRQTYAAFPEIRVVNRAVMAERGAVWMYRVDPLRTDLPPFTKGISSVRPQHHERSGTPQDAIVREKVEAITLNDLVQEFEVHRLDLLQIDTEGCDYEILMSVDLEELAPTVVNFEHGLRDRVMNEEEFARLAVRLVEAGYRLLVSDYDCLAFRERKR